MCPVSSPFTCCVGRRTRTTCSIRHKGAGDNKPLYLGHPKFEGFEVIQEVLPAKQPVG
jgi:hypothetical protein